MRGRRATRYSLSLSPGPIGQCDRGYAQFPRIPLLGISVNRGNPTPRRWLSPEVRRSLVGGIIATSCKRQKETKNVYALCSRFRSD
jgi:hypothetical protein